MIKNKFFELLLLSLVLISYYSYSQEKIKIICYSKQKVHINNPRIKIKIYNNSDSVVYLPIRDFFDSNVIDVKFDNQILFCTTETKRGYSECGYSINCDEGIKKNTGDLLKIKPGKAKDIYLDLSSKNGLGCIEIDKYKIDGKLYKYRVELFISTKMVGNYCKQLLTGKFSSNEGSVYFK